MDEFAVQVTIGGMGFRFRRTLKILPGIRLNLSRSGVSTSIGGRGAHITMGHGQVRETVGLPGTGISYTHVEGTHQAHQAHQDDRSTAQPQPLTNVSPKGGAVRGVFWWLLLAAIAGSLALRYLAHP
jgi:hypothetical protein